MRRIYGVASRVAAIIISRWIEIHAASELRSTSRHGDLKARCDSAGQIYSSILNKFIPWFVWEVGGNNDGRYLLWSSSSN